MCGHGDGAHVPQALPVHYLLSPPRACAPQVPLCLGSFRPAELSSGQTLAASDRGGAQMLLAPRTLMLRAASVSLTKGREHPEALPSGSALSRV